MADRAQLPQRRPPVDGSFSSRRAALGAVVVVALLSSVVTWIAAGHIRSPQDEAARREPPAPSTITATVASRVLSSRVVFRGDVVIVDPQSLVRSASGITTPVVTATPLKQGDAVVSGSVVTEIAGRPVLALTGAIPTFRDLGPTTRGADVLQLETALEQLGFSPGTIDGVYDSDTSAAVTALYRSHGYSPPPPGAELVSAASEAKLRQKAAADELTAAQTALANLTEPPTRAVVLGAESAVEVARVNLEVEKLSDSQVGGSAEAISKAEAAVAAAQTASDDSALATARSKLSDAISIADLQGKSRLEQLETSLELAELRLLEVRSKPNAKDQMARLDTARAELSKATANLAAATAATTTPFPASEFVFVQKLPQLVTSVFTELGQIAPETVMEVSDAGLAIVGVVTPAQHQLLMTGLSGTADEAGLDLTVTVVVVDVATQSTNGSFQVRLEATEGSLVAAKGLNLRVSIPVQSTGDAVLAVPFAALSSGPQGEARLSILRDGDVTEIIEVELGLSADGFVEITSSSGDLSVGDEVVIGRQANS